MTYNPRLAITLLLFFFSSCGFNAIYNDNKISENSKSYNQELASIKVQTIRKKLNQDLKNNLEDILNPDGIEVASKYLINITLNRGTSGTFVTSTGSAGRNKVTLTANYQLTNLESGELIATGSTFATDDFNIGTNRFANYTSEETIASNLTIILAKNIRNLLINDIVNSYKIREFPEVKKSFKEQQELL